VGDASARFVSLTGISYGARIFLRELPETSREVQDPVMRVCRSWRFDATHRSEVFVRRLGLKAFLALFVALVVTCAFDGPHIAGATPADFGHGASFCGVIHAASALAIPPSEPAPQAYSDERIQPPSDVHSMWPLGRTIDHPPRLLG
jgi:hypothetical protein